MKNKFMTGIMGVMAVVTMMIATAIAPGASVAADDCPPGSIGSTTGGSSASCYMTAEQSKGNGSQIWTIANNVINVILAALGIVAVAMIIYGGFKFLTSAGDAGKVKSGKDTIVYGIVGLVIALLAYTIVNFVLNSVFSSSNSGSGDNNNNNNSNSVLIEEKKSVRNRIM